MPPTILDTRTALTAALDYLDRLPNDLPAPVVTAYNFGSVSLGWHDADAETAMQIMDVIGGHWLDGSAWVSRRGVSLIGDTRIDATVFPEQATPEPVTTGAELLHRWANRRAVASC